MLSQRTRQMNSVGKSWDGLRLQKAAALSLLLAFSSSASHAWFPDTETRDYVNRTVWNPDPGDFQGEEHGMMRSPPIMLPDDWVLAGRTTPTIPRTWSRRLDQVAGRDSALEALTLARLGRFDNALKVAREANLKPHIRGAILFYRILRAEQPAAMKDDANEAIGLLAEPKGETEALVKRMILVKRDFLKWAYGQPSGSFKPPVSDDADALLCVRAMAAVAYTEMVKLPDWFDGMGNLYEQLKAPFELEFSRQMAQNLRLEGQPTFSNRQASIDVEIKAAFLGFKNTAVQAQNAEAEWMEKQATAGKLPESTKDYWKNYSAVAPPESSSVELSHEDRKDYPPPWDKRAPSNRKHLTPRFLTDREAQDQDMMLTIVIAGAMVLALIGMIYFYVTRGRFD